MARIISAIRLAIYILPVKDIAELEQIIGFRFTDKNLLLQALTHRSYLNENPAWNLPHNERLEFLGDAVIELIVTRYLYDTYPNPEGELTNWRASLVNAIILAKLSAKFSLNEYLLLSRGETKDTGRARQYILANAFEAVVGALYLDQGYEAAVKFIEKFVLTELPTILKDESYRDAKSRFQEDAQERIGVTPNYEVLEESGPDHSKQFRVGVFLKDKLYGEGTGASKQDAQQVAAEDALKKTNW